jgi:Sec-independent protein translocase protein TatA
MEILGVGPLEFIFILLIALIVLGPTDMVKAGKTIGRFLRRLVISPGWRNFQQASRELRTLPNKLMRDAGLEEELEALREISRETSLPRLGNTLQSLDRDISSWTTPPPIIDRSAEATASDSDADPSSAASEETKEG